MTGELETVLGTGGENGGAIKIKRPPQSHLLSLLVNPGAGASGGRPRKMQRRQGASVLAEASRNCRRFRSSLRGGEYARGAEVQYPWKNYYMLQVLSYPRFTNMLQGGVGTSVLQTCTALWPTQSAGSGIV